MTAYIYNLFNGVGLLAMFLVKSSKGNPFRRFSTGTSKPLKSKSLAAPERVCEKIPAMKIGYARVSTDEQNLGLQLDALQADGCGRVFRGYRLGGQVEPEGSGRCPASLLAG